MPMLTHAVRDHRHARLRAVMAAQGWDGIALTGADFFAYAANHYMHDLAWERPFLLVLPAAGPSFAVLADQSRNQLLAEQARGSLWLDVPIFYAETPRPEPDARVAPRWRQIVAEALAVHGLAQARIGCDAIPAPLAGVRALLPGLTLEAGGTALRPARWQKHAEELATMRACAALSAWALPLYREELRPGRSVAQADLALAARLVAEAERRFPGENFVLGKAVTVAGPASASPHGDGAGCGQVVPGSGVAVSTLATRLNGLAMEAARTWLLGPPDARTRALFDCAGAAQAAGMAAAATGCPVSGIDAAARAAIAAAGFSAHLLHRGGHGIGVVQHDFPEDMPFNDRALLANEVYAVEPGLYVPGLGGFRNADLVVVGDPPERLPAAPTDAASCRIG